MSAACITSSLRIPIPNLAYSLKCSWPPMLTSRERRRPFPLSKPGLGLCVAPLNFTQEILAGGQYGNSQRSLVFHLYLSIRQMSPLRLFHPHKQVNACSVSSDIRYHKNLGPAIHSNKVPYELEFRPQSSCLKYAYYSLRCQAGWDILCKYPNKCSCRDYLLVTHSRFTSPDT